MSRGKNEYVKPEVVYYGAKMGCQDRDGYSG